MKGASLLVRDGLVQPEAFLCYGQSVSCYKDLMHCLDNICTPNFMEHPSRKYCNSIAPTFLLGLPTTAVVLREGHFPTFEQRPVIIWADPPLAGSSLLPNEIRKLSLSSLRACEPTCT